MKIIDAASVAAALPPRTAIRALQQALRDGLDPEADPPRTVVPVDHGQLLLMPAEGRSPRGRAYAGVKMATVAPDNPARGLPRIQGQYLLLDAETLTPLALLDGVALTSLRTAAVSAAAADLLAPPDASRLVLFGGGPQAHSHLAALRAIRPPHRGHRRRPHPGAGTPPGRGLPGDRRGPRRGRGAGRGGGRRSDRLLHHGPHPAVRWWIPAPARHRAGRGIA
ncbi:ornithine cyclodeaminase/mu-crystallin [Streptomyces himastatinicus ATCC 53653]|uniref:Ornithine cyclodeaminase/mu-crystallin n=1 Tax=Streptomyces himastatinicus ATCC 53653 TaxID=457427 RepID=D9WV23_9ACTN|nr:ornithine cyclodeaminase/mu-crystallin [Streptomyces himastatinicus ATCC 53653]